MNPHIQSDPGWKIVTGPDIGPAAPTITFAQEPQPTALVMQITGVPGKYADGVCRSADYPIPPKAIGAVLTATFTVDDASLLFTQALELGAKFTLDNGMTLNGQLQFDYGKAPADMTLDLTSIAGSGWSPTQIVRPKFAPGSRHRVVIVYKWTATNISVMSITIDGTLYPIPLAMQGVAGKMLGWGRNLFQVNFQPNTNPKGGTWGWTLDDVGVDFVLGV